MVEVTFDVGRVYVHLPPQEWVLEEGLAVYRAFKSAHALRVEDEMRFLAIWQHRFARGTVIYEPQAGSRFIAAPYKQDAVELLGYCAGRDYAHEEEFFRRVQEYFSQRGGSPPVSRNPRLLRTGAIPSGQPN